MSRNSKYSRFLASNNLFCVMAWGSGRRAWRDGSQKMTYRMHIEILNPSAASYHDDDDDEIFWSSSSSTSSSSSSSSSWRSLVCRLRRAFSAQLYAGNRFSARLSRQYDCLIWPNADDVGITTTPKGTEQQNATDMNIGREKELPTSIDFLANRLTICPTVEVCPTKLGICQYGTGTISSLGSFWMAYLRAKLQRRSFGCRTNAFVHQKNEHGVRSLTTLQDKWNMFPQTLRPHLMFLHLSSGVPHLSQARTKSYEPDIYVSKALGNTEILRVHP